MSENWRKIGFVCDQIKETLTDITSTSINNHTLFPENLVPKNLKHYNPTFLAVHINNGLGQLMEELKNVSHPVFFAELKSNMIGDWLLTTNNLPILLENFDKVAIFARQSAKKDEQSQRQREL